MAQQPSQPPPLTASSSSLSAGLVPEPTRQVEEAQEDHQRVPLPGHAPAHAPRPAPVPVRSGGGSGHGRQPLLLPRQRHPLGHGRDARRVPAAAPAFSGSPAGHGAVPVPVQPRRRAAAQLHGSIQHVVQRRRAADTPLPAHVPRDGVLIRPEQRDRLASAVWLPGQWGLERDKHRVAAPQSAGAHSIHELHLVRRAFPLRLVLIHPSTGKNTSRILVHITKSRAVHLAVCFSPQSQTRGRTEAIYQASWPLSSIGLVLFKAIIYYFACSLWRLFICLFKFNLLVCSVYIYLAQPSPVVAGLSVTDWFLKTISEDTLKYTTVGDTFPLCFFFSPNLLHSMQLWRAKGACTVDVQKPRGSLTAWAHERFTRKKEEREGWGCGGLTGIRTTWKRTWLHVLSRAKINK